jgi:hypothetical protein
MKNLFFILKILILQFILVNNALGQRKEDVVYLSNGTIIRGIILKDSTARVVRILNHAGDTWVFDLKSVDSVKSEKPFEYKLILFNQHGFELNINAELMMRSGNNAVGKAAIPGINMLFGYRCNPYFTAGAEIGIEFYDWMEIPVSASFRLRAANRVVSPLVFIRAGYTFPGEKRIDDWEYKYKSKGGYHSTAGAGIERIINKNASVLFTFSYHYQELNYHLTPLNQWSQARDRTEAFSRLRLTLGYVFK